jgi:hypothetical protein
MGMPGMVNGGGQMPQRICSPRSDIAVSAGWQSFLIND